MKSLTGFVITAILMMVAAPAWSASAVAVYWCQQGDNASEDDVDAAAAEWLKAAKLVEGGKNLEVEIMYPLAATMGDNDFIFLVKTSSIAEWGTFMDNYAGDTLADEDKKFADIASCADSALWESVKID
ncbi:MAG: hypothetical protein WBM36_07270 [Lysobacterales bacterium]